MVRNRFSSVFHACLCGIVIKFTDTSRNGISHMFKWFLAPHLSMVAFTAGDFTNYGAPKEIAAFANWISSLPHKFKVVIAGNHEYSMDLARKSFHQSSWDDDANNLTPTLAEAVSLLKSSCIYLEDSMTEILGLKIYGNPLSVGMGAFGVARGSKLLKEKVSAIPSEIDILITHGPPAGKLALDRFSRDMGDEELRSRVLGIKPMLHVFGHIHESYGTVCEDGIHFVNAAIVDRAAPVIIDLVPSHIA